MKNILGLIAISMLAVTTSFSQVTFSPGVFSAEDEVTLTVDVTGEPVAGQSELFIWLFSNPDVGGGKDGITNTSWSNSPTIAKMTSLGANKWSYTFTGTTMFGQTPGELKSFGFLAKTKDGSRQSKDYKPFPFDPLVFTPSKLRVFPSKVGKDDVVTVNFEQGLATTVFEQRMTPVSATIIMFDNTGIAVGVPLNLTLRKTGANIWSASFIGSSSFTPGTGRQLKSFKYKFNGTMRDESGATINVSSDEATVEYSVLK
jgi:hypothetical protein